MERRSFLSVAAATAAGAFTLKEAILPGEASAQQVGEQPGAQRVVTNLWGRHLQFVATQAQFNSDPYGSGVKVGEACVAGGFAGVDVTIRSDGMVQPTLAAQNLPLLLQGIRSAGARCDQFGNNIAPPLDPANTSWIQSQFVHEILSAAASAGLKKYRFNNSGAAVLAADTFGAQMTAQLDGFRLNLRRLAAINAQYGNLSGFAHTHEVNLGITVYDYNYAMQGIDPNLIGINLAVDHTAVEAPNQVWKLQMRTAMPKIRGLVFQDIRASVNPTTGALTIGPAQSTGATGVGAGIVDWQTFFTLARLGGYSGNIDAQPEFTIVGALGISVSLNVAYFADNPQFTSGNLTTPIMTSVFKQESDFIRQRAIAGGWTAAQII